PEEFENLPEKKKDEIMTRQEKVNTLIQDFIEKVKQIQRETKEKIEEYNQNLAAVLLAHPLDRLIARYSKENELVTYLQEVKLYMSEHYQDFLPQPAEPVLFVPGPPEKSFVEYEVNVIVEQKQERHPPIVFEPNPTVYNLFGKVEKRPYMGGYYSDFTMIHGGSLHRANGGFLLVYARDLLLTPGTWEGLKRALKFSAVVTEDIAEQMGYVATIGLRPQPIPLDVKVVLIRSPYVYNLLATYDEDLPRIFKVRADFDSVIDNTPTYLRSLLNFVANACKEDGLLPFEAGAVGTVAEYMARVAGSKNKLTARFGLIRDVLREADFVAQQAGAQLVTAEHVKKSLDDRVYRSDLVEQKIDEMIRNLLLLVDVRGKVVGQVNGLSVYQLGDYSFGRPSRITAQTFVGQAGVIDIEREVELSGPIHEKGVMILSGLLAGKFAQKLPLSVSATLCFEQSYSGVEGDSASAAEFFALISQLAEVPLRQDIGVTGSINQKGCIQAIGGVNEKTEGFYKVCKLMGLTGTQGVAIPKSNVQELMLSDEVVGAVRAGRFRVYAMETVEDGIEILTGMVAGTADEKGDYPRGSVYHAVAEKLRSYRDRLMENERRRR
ncbi:MAG: Lon protease family protein, partial [bacterium]